MPHRCQGGCGSPSVRSAGGTRSFCFVAYNAVAGHSSSIPPCRTRSWPDIRSSDPIPSDGSGAVVRTRPTRHHGASHRPTEIHSKRSASSSTRCRGPPPARPRTRSAEGPWATSRTPTAAYERLRARTPSTFGGFLEAGDHRLLSASPERFLRVRGRDIETRPIKGTRPRGRTPAEDERLARELLASEKDAAENVMIVDLERNDLGKVCEFGSVHVPLLKH